MSILKVDNLRSPSDSSVVFTKGIQIGIGSTIISNIICGVCTASAFVGDGSGLTNLSGATIGFTIAQNITSI